MDLSLIHIFIPSIAAMVKYRGINAFLQEEVAAGCFRFNEKHGAVGLEPSVAGLIQGEDGTDPVVPNNVGQVVAAVQKALHQQICFRILPEWFLDAEAAAFGIMQVLSLIHI